MVPKIYDHQYNEGSTALRVTTALIDVYPITTENLDDLKPLYEAFYKVAQTDYGWPQSAIDYNTLRSLFRKNIMQGYLIKDFAADRYLGFMFYQVEAFGALEIKVIYLHADVAVKPVLDVLFNRFNEDVQALGGWEVVSYPMLGEAQMRYIRYITWYGYKPVGQAVLKFNMFDGITIEIFKKQAQSYPPLPEGYRFISYDPKYEEGVIDVIAESFADAADAFWDPRFRTRQGVAEAIAFVKSGMYGIFWPSSSSILLNPEDKPVGVCFLNIVSREEANIPLIGLLKSERKHKFGKRLLTQTVDKCIHEVLTGKLGIGVISATTATGNIPAIKMYRHTAFQEEQWYPHVYQEKSSVLARKKGQWC